MNDNPFAAGPCELIPQEVRTCDTCGRHFTDHIYSIEVRYCDKTRIADCVCPECMQRLGFAEPMEAVPTSVLYEMNDKIKQSQNLVDIYERVLKGIKDD